MVAEHKKPTLEILQKCEDKNPHGGGMAFFIKGKKHPQYIKSLTAKEIFERIQTIELPFAIHFRYASVGGRSPFLTHPFEISAKSELKIRGNAPKLLMHNGHISDWEVYLDASNPGDYPDKYLMSDTRAIAMIIRDNNEKFLKRLNGYYVVIDGTGKDEYRFKLFGSFIEEDGILYSNMQWKWYTKSTPCHNRVSSGYPWNTMDSALDAEWEQEMAKYEGEFEKGELAKGASKIDKEIQLISDALPKRLRRRFLHKTSKITSPSYQSDRIHEQPPESHFSDNTKKILGIHEGGKFEGCCI